MDPLSVTSGIVGIIAFAFQLAKTASKVKRAVEEIKSAPNEARNLIERLVMLETACQLIGFHLERRETLPNPASPTFDILSKALGQFLARAQELEQSLLDLSACNGLNQTPWPKSGIISCVRLVLRKDKISFLVQEIDRVISLLQFVIQVDMWTSTSIPTQPPSLSSNEIELVDGLPNLEGGSSSLLKNCEPSQCAVNRKFRRAQNEQCRTFQYLGYITWTIVDGWVGDEDDELSHITHRKGHISFQLPFTTTQLRVQYHGGMGTPSYALNVAHIIDQCSDLGRRLHMLMYPYGNLEKFRELISSREVSIYSLYRWYGEEYNLFFMAVASRWAEGCRYLLQNDFRHKFEEDEAPKVMFWSTASSSKICEITEIFLSVRSHDLRQTDFKYLLDIGYKPEYFVQYLNVFLKSPTIDHSDILSFAWKSLVGHVFLHESDTYSNWIPALRTLVDNGADLHQPCILGYTSAYMMILSTQVHPFDADDRAYSWLEMLKACGVDISSYLETETTLIDRLGFSPKTNARKMKKITLDFDGLPMPSWRWALPTESSIIEVIEEFLNLGTDKDLCTYSLNPAGPEDVKSWKAEIYYRGWGSFPFLLSPLDRINVNDQVLDGPWCRETYNRAVEIRDKRFMRRRFKKWRKAHPGEKPLSKSKMPGTWVD